MEIGAGSLGLLFLAVGHISLNKIVELLFYYSREAYNAKEIYIQATIPNSQLK